MKRLFVLLVIMSILFSSGCVTSIRRGDRIQMRLIKVQGDLRILRAAIDSYERNNGKLPPAADYQMTLMGASPRVLETNLYDPFVKGSVKYKYVLTPNKKYYVIYSVGRTGEGRTTISDTGMIISDGQAVWDSNGHL